MLHSIDDVLEVAYVSTGELDPDANTPTVSAKGAPLGDDINDAEDLSPMPVYGALGVTARPAARTDQGSAECLVARGIGDGVVLGMRDPRSATVYGNLAEGDTAVHSTDADQSAQMLLKGESKIASVIVKQADGKQQVFAMDGTNKKIQIVAFGAFIELNEDSVSLGNEGSSIQFMKNGTVLINCSALLIGAGATVPLLTAPTPGIPSKGVFVGI